MAPATRLSGSEGLRSGRGPLWYVDWRFGEMIQTIVVIEDEPDLRAILRDALEARGYRVISAKHGAEGVTMVRRHRPDLVLMDVKMPVMDGVHALAYLKADPQTARVAVWGLSAYASADELREQPGYVRFDRVLSKPIDPGYLVREVESYLGPPRPTVQ